MTLHVTNFAATASYSQSNTMIHKKVAASFDGHEHLPQSPSPKLPVRAFQQTPNSSISCKIITITIYTMPAVKHKYPECSAISETLVSDILSACHTIDRALDERKDRKLGWDAFGPLYYLSEPLLLCGWQNELERLGRLYKEGSYTNGEFEGWLKGVLPVVDKLEEGRDKLAALLDEKKRVGCDVSELEELYKAIEKRCEVLERAFKGLEMRLR